MDEVIAAGGSGQHKALGGGIHKQCECRWQVLNRSRNKIESVARGRNRRLVLCGEPNQVLPAGLVQLVHPLIQVNQPIRAGIDRLIRLVFVEVGGDGAKIGVVNALGRLGLRPIDEVGNAAIDGMPHEQEQHQHGGQARPGRTAARRIVAALCELVDDKTAALPQAARGQEEDQRQRDHPAHVERIGAGGEVRQQADEKCGQQKKLGRAAQSEEGQYQAHQEKERQERLQNRPSGDVVVVGQGGGSRPQHGQHRLADVGEQRPQVAGENRAQCAAQLADAQVACVRSGLEVDE